MAAVMLKALKKLIAEALIAEDGPLDGAVLMLWSNAGFDPGENTVYADLVAADFSGYAVSDPLVWGAPYLDDETGEWAIAPEPVEFRSTTATPFVPDTIRGYAIYVPGTPNVLRVSEKLEEPFYFNTPDKVLVVRPEIIGLGGSSVLAN